MEKFDIVSFGSAVIDNFITTNITDNNKFLCYPIGAKILITDLKFDVGGGGANTAVAFSRLGFKTGCVTKIGNDIEGKTIQSLFNKENIKFLGSVSNDKTGRSIIMDSKDKDRTILTFKGPVNDISKKDIKKFDTGWLYLSSVLGKSFKTQNKMAKELYQEGTKIAFNPSTYLIENKNIKDILKITSVLIVNKEEAECIIKKYNIKGQLESSVYSLGPKIVVITNGDKGASCYDGNKIYKIKAKKVRAVEITGAGDAFAAGFVSGMLVNWPIERCLKLAVEESSAVISHIGSKKNLIVRNLKRIK